MENKISSTQHVEIVSQKSEFRELLQFFLRNIAIFFFISTFFFKSSRINSPSMQNKFLDGDLFFCNIFAYGGRTPTTISLPFLPAKIDGFLTYLPGIILPSFHFKGWGSPKKGEVVTFYASQDNKGKNIYDIPVSKRNQLVKCVVATADDIISIKNGITWVNGAYSPTNKRNQLTLHTWLSKELPADFLKTETRSYVLNKTANRWQYELVLSSAQYEKYKWLIDREGILQTDEKGRPLSNDIIPLKPLDSLELNQYQNDMPEFIVPRKGMSIDLNDKTHKLYLRTISNIERFEVKKGADGVPHHYLDNKLIQKYTFKENHIFVRGYNCGNSFDGRAFGTFPESYITSRAEFILFNWKFLKHGFRFCKSIK